MRTTFPARLRQRARIVHPAGLLATLLLLPLNHILVMMIQRAGLPNGDNSRMRRAFQQAAVDELPD